VHDPQQPGADAVRLEIKRFAGADSAEVGFLDEIFGPLGVARESAGDAVQRVELFQRELLEMFTRRFQWSVPRLNERDPAVDRPGGVTGRGRARMPDPKYPNPPACLA
jgi:hypothetical protein